MSRNYYPEQLEAIVKIIKALNACDTDLMASASLPYAYTITLKDNDGVEYGELRDEIGGAYSWFPVAT